MSSKKNGKCPDSISSSDADVMTLGPTPDHYLHTHSYTLAARSCAVVKKMMEMI
jgi:hypothetical protein